MNLRSFSFLISGLAFFVHAPGSLRAQPALAPGEVLIERTVLPDAHASSFAFGLPGGINFCYDPVRGGVNYAWTGGFLDLTNVRPGPGKLIKPAQLLGPIVARESGPAPLRRGDPAHIPVIEFKGYTLRSDSVELRYTLDDTPVREEIAALSDGSGLRRTFRFDRSGTDAKWFYVTAGQPATTLTAAASGALVLITRFTPTSPATTAPKP
ncbi:MAG: hypothetical protein H7343_06065 [Undibacterium sp.]|nr:hypothetical protein [Opitutaceae bacterium]